jgi:choline monooxygenase
MSVLESVATAREAVEAGYTLPAAWYADPAVVELERSRIFARSWQYVGRSGDVAEPGQFVSGMAGHVPVVAVRGRDGELRGFVNVCRHRGHIVASGCGRRETLQCPYHAWTYGLDGSLRKAPRSEREPGFDLGEWSLLPVAVGTWGPFLFANPDPAAAPLVDALGDLPDVVAGSGVDVGDLRFRERREWTAAANWKVGIENYLECYHCSVAHPSFSKLIDVDPDQYQLRTAPTYSVQLGPIRETALTGERRGIPYVPSRDVARAQYHFLWPNITINIEPGPINLGIDVWLPDGAGATVGYSDQFFGPDVTEDQAREVMEFGQQVADEDTDLVISVQRGLSSGMVPHGRLLLSSEGLIQHFARLVVDALE